MLCRCGSANHHMSLKWLKDTFDEIWHLREKLRPTPPWRTGMERRGAAVLYHSATSLNGIFSNNSNKHSDSNNKQNCHVLEATLRIYG